MRRSPAPAIPGPEAAAWLADQQLDSPNSGLYGAELIDVLAVLERQAAWHAAQQAHALAQLHATEQAEITARLAAVENAGAPRKVIEREAREWMCEHIGLVLRIPGDFVKMRMLLAADLVARLQTTLAQLNVGAITPIQARLLGEAVLTLPDATAARIEARVLPRAAHQTSNQFRRSLHRAVLANTPRDQAAQDHADAVADRHVSAIPGEHGVGTLYAQLPATDLLRVNSILNGRATDYRRDNPDETRTYDQRRADALVELVELGAHAAAVDASRPTRPGPLIQVLVTLATLTGDTNEPAELAGFGPIPATLARHLAADPTGTWRRLVTDPLGQVIDYGRSRYQPPAELDQFIRARDQHCTYPHCNRQASTAEIDHLLDWDHGGHTNRTNLSALCGRHHHLKHDNNWTITRNTDTGSTTWTSPTGHTYQKSPPELPRAG